jgi:hypothetical protein
LLECRLAISFEPLGGGNAGREFRGFEGANEAACDRLVDLNAAHVQAINTAPFDENLPGTVVPR